METIAIEAEIRTVSIEDMPIHYVVIDGEQADAIRLAAMTGQWLERKRGFGSARVTVTIGATTWQTSVFPHKESGGWFLPLKAAVRRAECLGEGDRPLITVAL